MLIRSLALLTLLVAACASDDAAGPNGSCDPGDDAPGDDAAGDPDAAPATDAIKWHPGHYAWVDTVKSSPATRAAHLAALDTLADDPTVQGILVGMYWGDLEGAQGDYDAGFAILDEYVARAELDGKRIMLRIYDRIFGNIDPANLHNGYYFPAYLESDAFDGGWYSLPPGQALNTMVKMWRPEVMDRMIALMQALGARYDGNPAFEMVGLEETAASAAITGGGYTDAAYIEQLERWMIATRAAWPHTGVRLQLNYFISAYAECADLVALANTHDISLGGPDTIPPGVEGGLDWGDLAYLGDNGGIDYRGVIPMVAESQDYSLSVGFALADIVAGGIARGAQYFVWSWNSYSTLQWADDILPFIHETNGAVYSTVCPSHYPGCDSN